MVSEAGPSTPYLYCRCSTVDWPAPNDAAFRFPRSDFPSSSALTVRFEVRTALSMVCDPGCPVWSFITLFGVNDKVGSAANLIRHMPRKSLSILTKAARLSSEPVMTETRT